MSQCTRERAKGVPKRLYARRRLVVQTFRQPSVAVEHSRRFTKFSCRPVGRN